MPPQNNIEDIRRHEKSRITEELRISNKYNDNDSASLAKFRGLSNDTYAQKQVEKLSEAISERTIKIEELSKRMEMLSTGEIDAELVSSIKATTAEVNAKHDEFLEKKRHLRELKKQDSEFGKKKFKEECQGDRLGKEYYYKGALKHFNRATDSIPEYMTRELERMPNNHAYVWKNVYFWGKKQTDRYRMSQATQNQKGYKIIERWDNNYLYVYEKQGRMDEKLVSKTKRIDKRT